MFIIRKLVIKEWFRFFLSSSLILFLLFTIANLISGLLRGNVTTAEVFLNYLIELPESFNKILPVSCLIASLFCINKLKTRSELTAIFASGYSRKRFVVDLLTASIVVAFMQYFISGYLGPFAKRNRDLFIEDGAKKFRNLKGKGLRSSTIGTGSIWYKSDNYYFSFAKFDRESNSLLDVDLYYFDKNYKLEKKVSSPIVTFVKDNHWIFYNSVITENLNTDGFPNIKKIKQSMFKINESPADFSQIEADITTLYVNQLKKYIDKLKSSGINTNEYEVLYYSTFSTSIICILFSLIAAIGIFNPDRRSSSFGKNIIFVFVFTLVYWLVNSYTLELGKSSRISSFFACFTVPLLFVTFLVYYFYRNKRLR